MVDAGSDRDLVTEIPRELDDPHARIRVGDLDQALVRTIVTAVLDEDELIVRALDRAQGTGCALVERVDDLPLVENGDHHRYQASFSHLSQLPQEDITAPAESGRSPTTKIALSIRWMPAFVAMLVTGRLVRYEPPDGRPANPVPANGSRNALFCGIPRGVRAIRRSACRNRATRRPRRPATRDLLLIA